MGKAHEANVSKASNIDPNIDPKVEPVTTDQPIAEAPAPLKKNKKKKK